MPCKPLIELNAIQKSYTLAEHTVTVLHHVTLEVRRGAMLAILGASGSGKSTLMNIIGLLDNADSGRYLLDGEEVTQLSEDEQARRRNRQIGFVFQQFNLLPRLNARHNVALPLHYRHLKADEVRNVFISRCVKLAWKNMAIICLHSFLAGNSNALLSPEHWLGSRRLF